MSDPLRLTIVNGSQRPQARSAKVADYLRALERPVELTVLDLHALGLPLWSDEEGLVQAAVNETWAPVSQGLHQADGFVIVAPEWNGMATPALKNFFLYCVDYELADKPALIVGVSSGQGGTYPVTELRATSYKNTQICYIPEHVILRQIEDILNGPVPVSQDDFYSRVRLDYGYAMLIDYARALRPVRTSGTRNFEQLPYGM